jgi:serine/threonine protein kinase
MTLTLNSIIENRYRIEKKLGQGGFDAVYQVIESRLYAPCAIL